MKIPLVVRERILIVGLLILALILFVIPTGFERELYSNALGIKARVVAVNNSNLFKKGVVNMGEQVVTVRLLSSPYK